MLALWRVSELATDIHIKKKYSIQRGLSIFLINDG